MLALNVHRVALRIHTLALDIHPVALNVHYIARLSPSLRPSLSGRHYCSVSRLRAAKTSFFGRIDGTTTCAFAVPFVVREDELCATGCATGGPRAENGQPSDRVTKSGCRFPTRSSRAARGARGRQRDQRFGIWSHTHTHTHVAGSLIIQYIIIYKSYITLTIICI